MITANVYDCNMIFLFSETSSTLRFWRDKHYVASQYFLRVSYYF